MSATELTLLVRIDFPGTGDKPLWQPLPTDYTMDEARERADWCATRYPRARVRLVDNAGHVLYESELPPPPEAA